MSCDVTLLSRSSYSSSTTSQVLWLSWFWWLTAPDYWQHCYNSDSPWTVLMQCTPEVPFLPLTTLSVAERNMYLVPPTVTPFMASSSVLAYLANNVFNSSTLTYNIINISKIFNKYSLKASAYQGTEWCWRNEWKMLNLQSRLGVDQYNGGDCCCWMLLLIKISGTELN